MKSKPLLFGLASFVVLGTALSQAKSQSRLELYKEYPQPGEDQEFDGYAKTIGEIQARLAQGQPIERAFHSKAHGCLKGTFTVLDSLPAELQAGVFEPGAQYPVWGRLSNASGSQKPDTARDMRGFALKLLDVPGGPTQDFLMTNGPVHFAKDAAGMIAFAEASSKGGFAMVQWFATHFAGAKVLLKDTSRKVPSMTTETYWSRVPFRLGKAAMKFNAEPCSKDVPPMPKNPSATYLTDDLRERAKDGPICFIFRVQMQRDPERQPIEDASVEWKESDTPSIPVAKIVFPAQTFDSTEQLQACNDLSFSPWHALPEHRPLGNMNRARKRVYDASAWNRGSNSEK